MKTASTASRALGPRKHKLLTQADIKRIPDLCVGVAVPNEDRKVPVKFFSIASQQRWYVLEGEVLDDGDIRLYAWSTGSFADEFGYVLLSELESWTAMAGRLPLVERDTSWIHTTTLADVLTGAHS